MNEFLKKLLLDREGLSSVNHGAIPVHDNPGTPRGNKGIHWETGIIISSFVEAKKPKQIVELGTFRGYSTCWIMAGIYPDAITKIDTYDVWPEGQYGEMWYDRYQFPKENLTFHEVSGGIWKHLKQVPAEIDFLYHDTAHEAAPTKKEMDILLPRIPIGGMVLIDDVLHPNYLPMRYYLHNLFTVHLKDFWRWNVMQIGCGLGIAERMK